MREEHWNQSKSLHAESGGDIAGDRVVQQEKCRRSIASVVTAFLTFALSGCGGIYDATVSGTVSLDGTKLTVGTVSFHPVAGGPASYAQVSSDGSYVVQTGREQGLKSGDYFVTVEANERPMELRSPDGGPPAIGKRITPPWYGANQTSGLRFTIEGGRNTINLELTSGMPEGFSSGRAN